MEWIEEIAKSDPSGFWVNILAGIPYLFFDLIIITMLLPVTIQWWEERRWQDVRLRALFRLRYGYEDFSALFLRDHCFREFCHGATPEEIKEEALRRIKLMPHLIEYHAQRMEMQAQTALPILGPTMAQDLLDFHYAWLDYLDLAKRTAEAFLAGTGKAAWSLGQLSELVYDRKNIPNSRAAGIKFRALEVAYSIDEAELERKIDPLKNSALVLDALAIEMTGVCSVLADRALDQNSVMHIYRVMWNRAPTQALEALRNHNPVVVHRNRGILGRLRGLRKSPLVKLQADFDEQFGRHYLEIDETV